VGDEIHKAIRQHVDDDHLKFTIQIWITILAAFGVIAGQWYVTQYRIDQFDIAIKKIASDVSTNKQAITSHIQWEMEHELSIKQKEIERLKRQLAEERGR